MRFLNSIYFKLLAFILIAFILYQECFIKNNKDFDIFIGASKLVFEGKDCYDVWIKSGSEGLKYFYSPFFAVLMYPLKELPQVLYTFIWTSLNILIIYRIFCLFPFFLPQKKISENKKKVLNLLVLAFTVRYILDNLDLGQMTVFLVWASMESMRLISEKKYIFGAALLALIINIKLIPLSLIFYLIYKKEFRAVVYTSSFFIIYLFIPSVFIGYTFNNELLHHWLNSLTGIAIPSVHDDEGRQGLSSLIPSLLIDTPIQFNLKRNFVNLQEGEVNYVLNSVRLVILALVAFLIGKPFQELKNKKSLYYDLSLICLVTPLIFPHQGKYSFFYLLPAYSYCIYSLVRMKPIRSKLKNIYQMCNILLITSFCLVTLTTDGLIGRTASDFTEYIHLIAYGSFLLLAVLFMLKPKIKRLKTY
jgi:hypothetical protein